MTTLTDVRRVQPGWFSPVSKRYFGDIKYLVLRGKVSGDLFLVRSTYNWTEVLDGAKKVTYRVNKLDQSTLEIGDMTADVFETLDATKVWLESA